ncbi:hypothetical protein [Tsukamurella strandjordii]|uniref:hypothetical protein n=1 Tax=Tsukamurella strandjordii TaxID=147577 RepID=UPI0031DB4AAC
MAQLIERKVVKIPADVRENELAWVRRDFTELLVSLAPESVVIQAVGGSPNGISDATVARVEVEGVIRSVLGELGVPGKSIKKVSLASAFGIKRDEFEELQNSIDLIAQAPKSHRPELLLAVSQLG